MTTFWKQYWWCFALILSLVFIIVYSESRNENKLSVQLTRLGESLDHDMTTKEMYSKRLAELIILHTRLQARVEHLESENKQIIEMMNDSDRLRKLFGPDKKKGGP